MAAFKRLLPTLDRVLVEKIAAPSKTLGGVLLPESAVQKVRYAQRLLSSCRASGKRGEPAGAGSGRFVAEVGAASLPLVIGLLIGKYAIRGGIQLLERRGVSGPAHSRRRRRLCRGASLGACQRFPAAHHPYSSTLPPWLLLALAAEPATVRACEPGAPSRMHASMRGLCRRRLPPGAAPHLHSFPCLKAGELVPVSVKEGDKVLLPEYGGTTVKLQEKE